MKLRGWLVLSLMALCLGSASAADKRKPNKDEPAAKPKAGVFDDLPEADDDAKADPKEMKDDAKEADAKEESEGFGSGRVSKKRPAKTETPKVDGDDKEKAKFVRAVQKKFNEKKAVYLLRTLEQGYEKTDDEEKARAAGLNGYIPYERMEFEICEGQEEGVSFVLDFMTEFGNPWEKKPKPTGRKKKESPNPNEPPKPVRDWEILASFPDKLSAEAARDQAINEYEHAKQNAGPNGPPWNR